VVDGGLQPLGTATVTEPFAIPPVGAVYVNVIVFPVEPTATEFVSAVNVPEPSAAYTVMLGDDEMLVSEPLEVDFSCVVHVCAPVDDVAVAPGPPLAVEPYVIVNVFPAARVTDETVIVLPETVSVPVLEVENPAALPVVDGGLQPLGTASVTEPLEMPPVGAVYVKVIVRPVWLAETTVIEAPIVPEPSTA
jgi:hypothetical protein